MGKGSSTSFLLQFNVRQTPSTCLPLSGRTTLPGDHTDPAGTLPALASLAFLPLAFLPLRPDSTGGVRAAGRLRRGHRSTLINETISTGRAAERFSSVPGAACRAAALSFRPILFLPRAAAKPRQFRQSRSSRAGSEK